MKEISVENLKQKDFSKILLIDVREPEEYNEVHIEGSELIPLGQFDISKIKDKSKEIIVLCRSGARSARACLRVLQDDPDLNISNLEGGILAWIGNNYPIIQGKKKISVGNQVMIIVGLVIFLSSLSTLLFSSLFAFLSLFIGLGLLYAGLSGNCMLANFLSKMPWNK